MEWDGSLTVGGVQRLFNDEHVPGAVFQIMDMKLVTRGEAQGDRHRLIVSDGQHFVQAMLATQCHKLVESGELQKGGIIRLKNIICNQMHGRRILILIDLDVLSKPIGLIGNPQAVDKSGSANPMGNASVSAPAMVPTHQVMSATPVQPMPMGGGGGFNAVQPSPYGQPMGGGYGVPTPMVTTAQPGQIPLGQPMPINMLGPFQAKFTIKARVTRKSDMRQYHTQKGQGQLFSVDLVDESGEIRATAFNEDAERLYKILEEQKVYFISKGQIKMANKQYTSLACDYEITFSNDTEVVLVNDVDGSGVPQMKYNFVPIAQIDQLDKDAIIDVIGIAKESSQLGSVTMKSSGNQISKRDMTLVDTSQKSVRLTVWGKTAEDFSSDGQPVVGCKGVRVSDFGGKSLTSLSSSSIVINPQLQEAFQLRGWYDEFGTSAEISSLSTSGGSSTQIRKTVAQIKEEGLGNDPNTPDWFTLKAILCFIKRDFGVYYEACPGPDCNKKVVDDGQGTYSCEKCQKRYPNCEYRYMLSIAVFDHSGSIWMSSFNDQGENILGIKAGDLHQLKLTNTAEYDAVFDRATFKEFVFRGKAKAEMYNEESRTKYIIGNAAPIGFDFSKENEWLFAQIAKYEELA